MPEAPALPDLTEAEARLLTDRIRGTAESLMRDVAEAHDRRAWAALGYRSWDAYTDAEFHMSRGQSYRLVEQARTVAALEEAAGVERGAIDGAVSARAAQDLKGRVPEVARQVKERTRGTRKALRPEIVEATVAEARQRPPEPEPEPEAPDASLLEQALTALMRRPPVEARSLPAGKWARAESWFKQAKAVREPVQQQRRGRGKAPAQPEGRCMHPINRRLGNQCAECGETVK